MITTIYLCPADKKYGCSWEGSSDDIFEHFSQEHEELLYSTQSVNVSLLVSSENRLLLFDNEIYLLQTRINEGSLNIYLRYLGPDKIASKLTYDIEISASGAKIAKQDVEIKDGHFSVTLECIQSCLGEEDSVECRLLVNGDFNPSSPISVAVESPKSPLDFGDSEAGHSSDAIEENGGEHFRGSLLDLDKLFGTPKEGNSPEVEIREKKLSLDETHRFTWNGHRETQRKRNLLERSQTFTSEDREKHGIFQRYASVRSLSAIAETDLDSELKCSNCACHLAAPIFICSSKHNICSSCFNEKKTCVICNKGITVERNIELENKTCNYNYRCINKKNGCSQKLLYPAILDHESNCTFCQFVCPIDECGLKAPFKLLVNHLKLIHGSVKIVQSFIAIFQKQQELFLVNEAMGIFYCSWNQTNDNIIWRAKFCGPKTRKFFCELKFKGKNFKEPLLLTKHADSYVRCMSLETLKSYKVKPKHSILTITR
ncbi:uncharacterized protein [Euwallacea fornicatus]|uniref:uncharacterized protein n=1 Tax=Euwallacea fornicatus TaxID=995702 RepID=UPI00339067DB